MPAVAERATRRWIVAVAMAAAAALLVIAATLGGGNASPATLTLPQVPSASLHTMMAGAVVRQQQLQVATVTAAAPTATEQQPQQIGTDSVATTSTPTLMPTTTGAPIVPPPATDATPTTAPAPTEGTPTTAPAPTDTPLDPTLLNTFTTWMREADPSLPPSAVWGGHPIRDTGTIPRRLFVTWKTTTLPDNARQLLQIWREREPKLDIITIDDAACAALAGYYPDLKQRYDALPMNVMRADICRVLVVYYFGGLYKDLDVGHTNLLDTWLDWKAPVEYGWEDDEHLCQWFFAARPGDPCIAHVLQHITSIIAGVRVDFNRHVEAVIDITGPGAFTDGMRGCPTPPRFSVHQMKFQHVFHHYAAQRWQGPGYSSWLEQRKQLAGWRDMWGGEVKLDYYVLQPSTDFATQPDTTAPPIKLTKAAMSSVLRNSASIFGPHLALDGSLDTAIVTEQHHTSNSAPWFEIHLAAPMKIGTVRHAGADHLSGMRLYNTKRLHHTGEFNDGIIVELYNDDTVVHRTKRKGGTVASQFIVFGGHAATVNRIRVIRDTGDAQRMPQTYLAFSEIHLYSDPSLKHHRVTILDQPAPPQSLPSVVHLVTSNKAPCPRSTGVSLQQDFLFSLCDPPGSVKPCAGIVVSDKAAPARIDLQFATLMRSNGCSMALHAPVGPEAHVSTHVSHVASAICTNRSAGSRNCSEGLRGVGAAVREKEKALSFVAFIDVEDDDWAQDDSVLRWIDQVGADTLLLDVRLERADSDAGRRHLEQLTNAGYTLAAWHPVSARGLYDVKGVGVPKVVHTTWVRQTQQQ